MLDVSSDWKTMPKAQKVARVRALVEQDNLSARQIASHLGTTRGAVLGFCDRNGIRFGLKKGVAAKKKQTFKKQSFRLYQFPNKRPVKPEKSRGVTASSEEKPVAFLNVKNGQCRRPLWGDEIGIDISQKFFCGAPTGEGETFCPDCASQLFVEKGQGESR